MANSIIELHAQVPADQERNVFGQFDKHLKLIERTLYVTLISRDGILKTLGNEQSASQAKKLIDELVVLAKRGNTITKQNVTYALSLAMAMAVTAFRNEEVSRIILTRPTIEAGEKLGFLPGDLQSKVDP